jgi:hypothetical protein
MHERERERERESLYSKQKTIENPNSKSPAAARVYGFTCIMRESERESERKINGKFLYSQAIIIIQSLRTKL